MNELEPRFLPADDPQRHALHNEVHARPPARVRLPALVVYVAVRHEGVSREQEWVHLRQLPGHSGLALERLSGHFLRLRCDGFTVKWERHTEFTRYAIVQDLPAHAHWGAQLPALAPFVATGTDWLRGIPGAVVAAIELAMLPHEAAAVASPEATDDVLRHALAWLGPDEGGLIGSRMGCTTQGHPHSSLLTHLRVAANGFERMLVLAPAHTSQARAGRILQRVLELETYRLMALRGLPVAKHLSPVLAQAEAQLADITARLEAEAGGDPSLLNDLVSLAARVERATAEHGYRFAATQAYDALVSQRIAELRERALPGIQTVGEFMQRRLTPAMATVAATAQRLAALSERISRTSALLRTRVDIATETQNQVLLHKLTQGQALQLRLQSTVEGLSIAAISYYVISLVLYAAKAAQKLGLPWPPELVAGLSIPWVLWGVWQTVRRIHARIHLSG